MSERDDFLGRERSKSYDADGNLTGDGLWDYQYDAENRLIRMETAAIARSVGIPHRVLEYRYDYKGRRVQKRVLDGTNAAELSSRRYLYDGWNLIAEWTAPGGTSLGTLVRSYTWGLDLTGSLTGSGGVGALVQIADHATGKTYLPAYDGNGNVAALLNGDTGARAAVYEYDPYGKLLRHEVTDAAVADQPFLFSTKFTDRETGLVYYGYRYYSPALGRFVNRDPIEEQGGINLYAFCGNNGVNAWDVLGMDTERETKLKIEAAARARMGDTWWSFIMAMQLSSYRAPAGFGNMWLSDLADAAWADYSGVFQYWADQEARAAALKQAQNPPPATNGSTSNSTPPSTPPSTLQRQPPRRPRPPRWTPRSTQLPPPETSQATCMVIQTCRPSQERSVQSMLGLTQIARRRQPTSQRGIVSAPLAFWALMAFL